MQQHVAQFLGNLVLIAFDDGARQFVGLLDGILSQALEGLLPVPRTLLPKFVHDRQQPIKRLQLFLSCMHKCQMSIVVRL